MIASVLRKVTLRPRPEQTGLSRIGCPEAGQLPVAVGRRRDLIGQRGPACFRELALNTPLRSLVEPMVARLSRHTSLLPCELDALRDLRGRVDRVRSRSDFVRLGETTREASFISGGLVGRFDQNRKGDRQVVAIYFPGDIPDLHSVVMPQASAALHAFTASSLIRISHRELQDAANTHAGIALALWRESALDAVRVSKWVVSVGRKDALSRMAHLLCEFACRSTGLATPGTVHFGFPVTQVDLGDMLGLSPVHVNRTLKSLRLANLVTLDRGQVHILDWQKLARVADFDSRYLFVDEDSRGLSKRPTAQSVEAAEWSNDLPVFVP